MKALRLFIGLWLGLVLTACTGWGTGATVPQPSNDREWQTVMSRLSTVQWETPSRFALSNVRNWAWNADGAVRETWETRRHDVTDVRAIWFFVDTFRRVPHIAHTFMTFEFGEGAQRRFLTVSVEARREVGETYSVIQGMQGAYELIFAWSAERDILTDSVLHYGRSDVEMYRANVTPDQAGRILRGFLARTQELARRPERYNTLRHNCTTELAAVVNREFSDPIPWHSSFVLTGHAPRYLHELGFLGDPEISYERQRAQSRIAPLVRHVARLPERRFSTALRDTWAAIIARDYPK